MDKYICIYIKHFKQIKSSIVPVQKQTELRLQGSWFQDKRCWDTTWGSCRGQAFSCWPPFATLLRLGGHGEEELLHVGLVPSGCWAEIHTGFVRLDSMSALPTPPCRWLLRGWGPSASLSLFWGVLWDTELLRMHLGNLI